MDILSWTLSDPTFPMALNFSAVFQTFPTQNIAKQLTHFLNYCTTHPDTVTEYKHGDMIQHFYSDTSHMSESKSRSRVGGCFFLGTQNDTKKHPIEIPGRNGSIHIECSIMCNVIALEMEAELVGQSKKFKRENTSELPWRKWATRNLQPQWPHTTQQHRALSMQQQIRSNHRKSP